MTKKKQITQFRILNSSKIQKMIKDRDWVKGHFNEWFTVKINAEILCK